MARNNKCQRKHFEIVPYEMCMGKSVTHFENTCSSRCIFLMCDQILKRCTHGLPACCVTDTLEFLQVKGMRFIDVLKLCLTFTHGTTMHHASTFSFTFTRATLLNGKKQSRGLEEIHDFPGITLVKIRGSV